jgi:hypothetical protein
MPHHVNHLPQHLIHTRPDHVTATAGEHHSKVAAQRIIARRVLAETVDLVRPSVALVCLNHQEIRSFVDSQAEPLLTT